MFNAEDDYSNAIKGAQLYENDEIKTNNIKLIIFNFLLLISLAYIAFNYLKNNTNIFSSLSGISLSISKQAVLGVSETVDDAEFTNDGLMKILETTEVDLLVQSGKSYSQGELQNSMKILMNEPSIKSKSSYTEAIGRELEDKSDFKGRIVVVKKGDTLSSLSEKYYASSKMFSKIIKANKNMVNGNYILRIGETINIPN